MGGSYNYDELRVINGGTLYVQDGSKLTVNANSIYVDSTSSINADRSGYTGGSGGEEGGGQTGRGGDGGSGTGAGYSGGNDGSSGCSAGGGGGGAGYGGYGGNGGQGGADSTGDGGSEGSNGGSYGSNSGRSIELGSGAGGGGGAGDWNGANGNSGSRGGGALYLDASGTINIDGSVTANGGSGGNGGDDSDGCDTTGGGGGGGGASGGGILLEGNDVQISGTISAQGGNGGSGGDGSYDNGNSGQDGGGGRIKVFYGSLDDSSANYNVDGHDSGTTYFEQTNAPPNNPNNLKPSGGNIDVNPSISADYSDADGDSGTLYFEDDNGNNIGSCSVNDGDVCNVTYSGADQWGTGYSFQVYAEDTAGATSSTVSESFTTNYKPSVSNLQPSGSAVQLNPQFSADVDDQDGDIMNVTFYDASDNSVIGTDSSVASGGTATVQASSFDQTGTTYNWYAVADDGSSTNQSSTLSFTTEHEPEIDEASATPQGGETTSTTPDLSVDVNHSDGRTMDVTFFLNGTAFGSDQQIDGSGTATIQTDSLEANTVYEWSVVVDDRNGYTVDNQASPWSFETDAGNANISIDYGNNTNFGSGRAVLDVVPGHSHADTVDYVRLLDGSGTQIDEVQNVDVDSPVSLLWEGLDQDREYDWRAEVEHDGETAQTNIASFTTLTVGINLTSNVQDAETYNVYRRTGSSGDTVSFNYGDADYSLIGSDNTLNLVDGSSGLETGRSYCYIVTAENLGGESPGSSEMCTTSDLVLNP